MKVKKFIAKSVRQGFKDVRETFGEEAVILSNKLVNGLVEIVAAQDMEYASEMLRTDKFSEKVISNNAKVLLDAQTKHVGDTEEPLAKNNQESVPSVAAEFSKAEESTKGEWLTEGHALESVKQEISTLKELLSEQISGLAWQKFKYLNPMQAAILKKLTVLGVSEKIASKVISKINVNSDINECWNQSLSVLKGLLKFNNNKFIFNPGVFPVVGATGVGKTTLIAKLATYYLQTNDNDNIAIISLDDCRIGGYDRISCIANILNVPVYKVDDAYSLTNALNKLVNANCVLIDTPGIIPVDGENSHYFDILDQSTFAYSLTHLLASHRQGE